ncbi:Cytochrome P450 oxidoreductase, putative [Penicillium digitatum PHI26]|uniref:Cytochrome P450 oxidoreductase, putative n=2 Tax=Penicillium digitatum TaxID=36651 RepID=K9FNS1_PEND2|nr:Cytochrome P450 oxidoreductase, putative [Penicillium digitatum Pd1]EKV10844.1 Cytochrome P450 oxidoreductase, putative [Penicillium digitatum PHI26]EKV13361.1 Cytochrome P450 oxidoreductase, putative [Penicillium digitatum Pd1]
MSSYILLALQLAVVSLLVTFWRAFTPNSWSNRVISYVLNVRSTLSYIKSTLLTFILVSMERLLIWWYSIYSTDGATSIPTCPYRFSDGGESLKFLEGEKISRQ